jgi:hypothetical protein
MWNAHPKCPQAILAPMAPMLLMLVVTGCASAGHHFNYAAADSLELGQLQSSEYRKVFGEKPTALLTRTTSDGKFEIARYTYAYADMSTAESRVLILEFKDGNLNAFEHLSSFNCDKTAALVDDADQIKEGLSTKDDILRILGKPNGKAKCPSLLQDFKSLCDKGVEVWNWQAMKKLSTWVAAYGGGRAKVNSISVVFDANGIVLEIETNEAR